MPEIQNTIHTRPPAKLNLFLELIAKRQDGFHEIDTVMVAIDLCDEMRVGQIDADEIKLNVHWLPSTEIVAQRLGLMGPGIEQNTEKMAQLLQIPESDGNLVYRALAEFKKRFEVDHGFAIELGKRIPAGAGLGGASSDAASALLCAAELTGVSKGNPELTEIASSLGSDIPFFLGVNGTPVTASRGRGRGEVLDVIDMGTTLDFVVVYPSDSLSTPKVYANSTIAESPGSADGMVTALAAGNVQSIQSELHNQLSQPAKKNSAANRRNPRIHVAVGFASVSINRQWFGMFCDCGFIIASTSQRDATASNVRTWGIRHRRSFSFGAT